MIDNSEYTEVKPLRVKDFGMRWYVCARDRASGRFYQEYCCPQFRTKKEAVLFFAKNSPAVVTLYKF